MGTSGWAYRRWRERFYPRGLPTASRLSFYSERLLAVEINATFYRFPSERAAQRWRAAVPPGFNYSVKVSRVITHLRRLRAVEDLTRRLLASLTPLGPVLGAYLLQLPPAPPPDLKPLDDYLAMFAKTQQEVFDETRPADKETPKTSAEHTPRRPPSDSGPDVLAQRPLGEPVCSEAPRAIEFRNPSWFSDRTYEVLLTHAAAFRISDLGRTRRPLVATRPLVCVRLLGPERRYARSYGKEDSRHWAKRCLQWAAESHDVRVCFDNDELAHAALDADRQARLIAAEAGVDGEDR